MEKKRGSRFEADLGDIKLPPDAERRVAAEIQRVVLEELAKLDFRGDITIKNPKPTDDPDNGEPIGILRKT